MNDLLALVFGVLFLIFWVCVWIYGSALTQVYDLGKEDYMLRKNRLAHYKGLPRIVYLRGRRCAACTRNEKLKSRLRSRRLTI